MRKTCLAVSLLLMILHSPIARADDLPAPIVFVTNFLQLSADQTKALIGIIQARDAALQPIAAKLQADQQALGTLLESASPDAGTAGRLLLEIHDGQKQAGAIARDAALSFEATLTPEQHDRLQFVRQAAQVEPAIPAFRAVGLL
ncbi:MAG TPA: periplasmic heavy metal sensor [Thermoanaerobaculia bacterium]|nr:periplasmic heavy metal sensor [Thermoanaerobaculia bacterium]